MLIIARNKRSPRRADVLNSLQHNFNQDSLGLGIDKRGNHHMKVTISFFGFHFINHYSVLLFFWFPVFYWIIKYSELVGTVDDLNKIAYAIQIKSSMAEWEKMNTTA